MARLILTIDLGTSRLKVATYGLDGTLQHVVEKRHDDRSDAIGGFQDANQWWQGCVDCAVALEDHLTGHDVVGIGISGRGGAGVFADEHGEVVAHPWSDGRHQEFGARVAEAVPALPRVAHHLLAKYLWVCAHQARQPARAFYAKDWLLYKLTGAHVTDWSSGTDCDSWSPAQAALELPEGLLPESRLPWDIGGVLAPDAAHALRLTPGIPVSVGAHDGLAANIGAGSHGDRDLVITFGTHAVVRCTMQEQPESAYRFYGFPPDKAIVGANALWAGRAADWFADMVREPLAALEEGARSVIAGANGVSFLPYLRGQIAPERHPELTAQFSGMNLDDNAAVLYRALLEGSSLQSRRPSNRS